jgi:lysyl-tRNA synthetase class 2
MKSDSPSQSAIPNNIMATLRRGDELLRTLRAFFHQRNFIEVETPLLASEVIPELHIEPMRLPEGAFLQASPELHMKRLLAAGAMAIFQVTRSFRRGEHGPWHRPEFTIVEWYRVGDDMACGMNLLDELAQALLGTPPATRTTYAEAFRRVLELCPHTAGVEELRAAATRLGVVAPAEMEHADRDEWLNLLLATCVEPQLGCERPEIVYHYPATQAALARVVHLAEGYEVAERFELYYRGIELANGFHELTDAAQQQRRFEAVNAARVAAGRSVLPIPRSFLAALEQGLPDCTGVALGFDRVVMLAVGATSIAEVRAFAGDGP